MRRILDSRAFCWTILALPGAYLLLAYARDWLFYGEVVHQTGVLATQLLIATLALTPLERVFPKARWLRWLRARRRYLGVATFGYAALHAGVYLARKADPDLILREAAEPAMAFGWVALFVMLLLAVTSNDASVRRLGRGWKRLHRTVHVASALTFAHWILSAFDPLSGWVHLAVLAVILAIGFLRQRRFGRGST